LKSSAKITALFVVCTLATLVSAETLTGTVNNGTTNQPAAGDDVVLIKLAQGMEEAARTKTDRQGKFSFTIEDSGGPHLIRIIHQAVTYHTMAPPGTHSVEAKVYDVAKKVDGISPIADLMYIQAGEGQLGISRLFAVSNPSHPPRTQMNDRNFEFYLPEGVQIDQAQAQTEGGQWVDSAPVPQAEKDRYAFLFPLRPGTTQFQVSYHLPYNGSAKIDPKPLYPLEHLVVIFPRSIAFTPVQAGLYEDKQPPDQPKATAKVAANVHPGDALSFEISGTGMLQDQNSQEAGAEGGGTPNPTAAGPQAAEPRPGGGLGPPIEAPDPLDKYRPYILGGFALVLAGGAVYVAKRPRSTTAADPLAVDVETPVVDRAARTAAPARSGMLLEALKEEMFTLEVEHKQGSISQPEYEKARAALDQTLDRAIKREAQNK
jgi:hypothetical protein